MYKTPQRTNQRSAYPASPFTPPQYTSSLSQELKQVLYERNLLTAKSRKKGKFFDDIIVNPTSDHIELFSLNKNSMQHVGYYVTENFSG